VTSSTLNRTAAVSAEQVTQLRAMLEEQRDFRLEQLAQLHRPGPHGPLSSTNPEIFRSLADGARAALSDVQSALWRMDDGHYGSCVACGEPLETARLEILPQVARCMPCQREHDATLTDGAAASR
jgi:RNA polymerase-binding transcription factor DksA